LKESGVGLAEPPDSDSETLEVLHYSDVPFVFGVQLSDNFDSFEMLGVAAMGEIQPDDVQARREHLAKDGVAAACGA
jgi:hypothetical protein